MSKIALEHGATIDKFVGDAMLLFFGDPQTRGVREDALQCVRMAVAMQRRMADLQAIWREKGYHKPFRMRAGINTGFCNVGNFGSDMRMDYTIIGAEVNLAARLEHASDPDGIMCRTRRGRWCRTNSRRKSVRRSRRRESRARSAASR
jgi:class 3 adenylate cyclase